MQNNLAKRLQKTAVDNTIILAFSNFAYVKILENWLASINTLNIKNALIISLDESTFNYLKQLGCNTILANYDGPVSGLWLHRIKIIRNIMQHGYHIIHSDIDAVWLKDPIPAFFHSSLDYDMVFSQGTYWPKDIHQHWQFVLCCGLFYMKSNLKTLHFIKNLEFRVQSEHDDQISLNRLLYSMQVKWRPSHHYQLNYNGINFNCYNDVLPGYVADMNIALLPHRLFQRLHEASKPAYVKHIVSDKNETSKLDTLKQYGCLFIKGDSK